MVVGNGTSGYINLEGATTGSAMVVTTMVVSPGHLPSNQTRHRYVLDWPRAPTPGLSHPTGGVFEDSQSVVMMAANPIPRHVEVAFQLECGGVACEFNPCLRDALMEDEMAQRLLGLPKGADTSDISYVGMEPKDDSGTSSEVHRFQLTVSDRFQPGCVGSECSSAS